MYWLGWYFPRLPLECLGLAELAGPAAVTRTRGGRRFIDRGNTSAVEGGVRPGMDVSLALELVPELHLEPRRRERERQALESLGAWAWRYSAQIRFQPLLVLLEVGGSLRLFGGFDALVERMAAELPELGHEGRWAAAPTPLGAALLARARPGSRPADRAELERLVAPLPVTAFSRDPALCKLLESIGLRTLGDCLALPRPELGRRLGPEPLRRFDRLLGRCPDPAPPWRPPARFRQRLPLPAELDRAQALLFPARRLLAALCAFLRARDAVAQRLTWRLWHRQGPPTIFHLSLRGPTRTVEALSSLLQQRLERLALPAPVVELELRVDHWVPWEAPAADLFDEARRDDAHLLARLWARLGESAVRGVRLRADHRPEKSWRLCAPGEGAGGAAPLPAWAAQGLWMLPEPRPLAQRQGRPWRDGPLALRFLQRIRTGWWDEEACERDYYEARDAAGRRFWIYHDRRREAWYLHGGFD